MKWTKQTYEMVANILKDVGEDPIHSNGFAIATLGAIAEEFIAVFQRDNSNFDPVVFRKAVQPDELLNKDQ